jgi:hypothetical protein
MPKTTILRDLPAVLCRDVVETANAYSPETYVIDLVELRQIIFNLKQAVGQSTSIVTKRLGATLEIYVSSS